MGPRHIRTRRHTHPASLLSLILYLSFLTPSPTTANELALHSIGLESLGEPVDFVNSLSLRYEPDFPLFDRGIIGRAPADVTALSNNEPHNLNVVPGTTACYMIENGTIFTTDYLDTFANSTSDLDSTEEQTSQNSTTWRMVYISANTCLQPRVVTEEGESEPAPQLNLYVSISEDIQCPNPTKHDKSKFDRVNFIEGAVEYAVNATGPVFFGISAPNITTKDDRDWNFNVAISLDEYYYHYDSQNNSQLLWMDSDSSSVLLVTKNLTQDSSESEKIMRQAPPYEIYIADAKTGVTDGIRHSVCGLKEALRPNMTSTGVFNKLVTTGMTTRGPGNWPKQQFLLGGLNASSSYTGILVKEPQNSSTKRQSDSGTAGGGGIIYRATEFQTLSGTNCKVVTDLEFCDEIQYAVPGNEDKYNNTELAKVYDDFAKNVYANFEKNLAQIACEAPPESLYSLARNCDDCRRAYKRWLCTVSIPRCEDFMSGSNYSIMRNAFQAYPNGTKLPEAQRKQLIEKPYYNASRNAFIDETIMPGPYREILPCEDICYDVVQSCPAAMGFGCPQPGFPSFNVSYGQRVRDSTSVTCNYPGEARTKISGVGAVLPSIFLLNVAFSLALFMC